MKDSHICPELHPTTSSLRCWRRADHDGQHMTVVPNVDKNVTTKPLPARW